VLVGNITVAFLTLLWRVGEEQTDQCVDCHSAADRCKHLRVEICTVTIFPGGGTAKRRDKDGDRLDRMLLGEGTNGHFGNGAPVGDLG
jgi:hypothetical protein